MEHNPQHHPSHDEHMGEHDSHEDHRSVQQWAHSVESELGIGIDADNLAKEAGGLMLPHSGATLHVTSTPTGQLEFHIHNNDTETTISEDEAMLELALLIEHRDSEQVNARAQHGADRRLEMILTRNFIDEHDLPVSVGELLLFHNGGITGNDGSRVYTYAQGGHMHYVYAFTDPLSGDLVSINCGSDPELSMEDFAQKVQHIAEQSHTRPARGRAEFTRRTDAIWFARM